MYDVASVTVSDNLTILMILFEFIIHFNLLWMLKSYFNKKPNAVDTLVCNLCKKDIKAAKGWYSIVGFYQTKFVFCSIG